jgi:hypothetical protein
MDDQFRQWIADLESIRADIHEMFRLRRTFRDVAGVFERNPRLQSVGGHIWDWMLLNYAASVLIRLRRQVDNQANTVNLNRLLRDIIAHPEVITRGRRRAFQRAPSSERLGRVFDQQFTDMWVRQPNPADPEREHVDPDVVQADLDALHDATERVSNVASRAIAHRQRAKPGDVTYGEIDAAFTATEETLKKYYALIVGPCLVGAEPTPQFDTHEVFTFPWIEPRESR